MVLHFPFSLFHVKRPSKFSEYGVNHFFFPLNYTLPISEILGSLQIMATDGNIKVLGLKESPFDNRVRIALNLKGIPYEVSEENLFHKSELLLASNPVHKRTPVLFHGGKPICETRVILHYIDEVWTDEPRLLPSDPHDRSVARFWAAYLDDVWIPRLFKIRDGRSIGQAETRGLIEEISEGFALLEEAFQKCSKGKAFFGGDEIGFLDIAFGSVWRWILATELLANVRLIDKTKTPNLWLWSQRFCSHEAVKNVLFDPKQLEESYLTYVTRGWFESKR